MHRGSSKGARRPRPAPESLPLSASPTPPIRVELRVERGGRASAPQVVWVVPGTQVRKILRDSGHAPEGSAVLLDGLSIPLDTVVDRPLCLTVLPTFSGG